MEPWVLLWWSALVSAAALAVSSLRVRPRRLDWVAVALVVGGLAGAEAWFAPETKGLVSGAAWVVLILAPALLLRALAVAMARQRYDSAARLATAIAVLHPGTDAWETRRAVQVHAHAAAGRLDAARALLGTRVAADTAAGRSARALLLRIEGDWDALAAFGRTVPRATLEAEPAFAVTWLRALGETGARSELVEWIDALQPAFAKPGATGLADYARLYLFAYTGRRAATTQLLASRLPLLRPDVKTFWEATATSVEGDEAETDRLLSTLGAPPDLARALAWRRTRGPFAGEAQPAEEALIVREMQAMAHDERYGMAPLGARRPAPVTWGLTALIVLVFALEVGAGGSEDTETLLALGAFWPPWILAGEWWRLGAYQFLHFGPLHLAMNGIGLLVLGPGVERALGWRRFVAVYVVSGTAGGLLALVLTALEWRAPQVLVGASGGLMGLVGAYVAVLLRGHLRERSATARRRLVGALAVVVLQTVFDLATPQVSFFAHATGLVTGFVVASLLRHAGWEPAPKAAV